MSERPSAAYAAVAPPVSAVDHEEMLRAADAALARAARLVSAVRPFAVAHARSRDPRDVLLELRDGARPALRDGGRAEPRTDWDRRWR